MSVENLPDLNPPQYGEVVDADRPVLSFSWSTDGPHHVAAHRHPRAHIIHTAAGAFWAITPEGRWLVPAGQALWIPPGLHHRIYALGPASARMLFIDPAWADPLQHRCGTVLVSSLLGELLDRALEYGNDYPPDGPAARLARVMLDELAAMELAPLLLPACGDPRLAAVMERLIAEPGSDAGLEQLCRGSGASPRTVARLFRSETGMTFREWKTRLRLIESVERLARGASVTEVAHALGYASSSAFAQMFRSNLGVAPGAYRAAVT